jgi:hypothetical protein
MRLQRACEDLADLLTRKGVKFIYITYIQSRIVVCVEDSNQSLGIPEDHLNYNVIVRGVDEPLYC